MLMYKKGESFATKAADRLKKAKAAKKPAVKPADKKEAKNG